MLYLGGLFSPGLLDDVDSIYLEAAREMLLRHDFVTPYVDGVRFFDKPPLPYWLAAGSMHLFGVHDWAARLPLALLTLALLFATYALGNLLFANISPAGASDRAGLYSALILATSLGPYLFTRFYLPDIALALWTTLAIYLFLLLLQRPQGENPLLRISVSLGVVLGLSVLSKGLVGLVLPMLFAVALVAVRRPPVRLRALRLGWAAAACLLVAAPWHLLAALRNPAVAMPSEPGLPGRAGWAWFYLYNEHVARFFSRRIPHDYGQVPLLLFWLLTVAWLLPWAMLLPAAGIAQLRALRRAPGDRGKDTAFVLLLWAGVVVGFFSFSARQEYYSLPAVPALALALGSVLAHADGVGARAASRPGTSPSTKTSSATDRLQSTSSSTPRDEVSADAETQRVARDVLRCSSSLLLPFSLIAGAAALFLTFRAPPLARGTDIAALLAPHSSLYNLSLGHLLDLTVPAMAAFRLPLSLLAVSLLVLVPLSHLLRRAYRAGAANAALTASAVLLLLAVHGGLERFYPVLGSKQLADCIQAHRQLSDAGSPDLILLDGELTTGSSLLFYTGGPVSMLDARVNGLWFGSLWPGTPPVFESSSHLASLWAGPRRVYFVTRHAADRMSLLGHYGPVSVLATSGGRSVLVNRAGPGMRRP